MAFSKPVLSLTNAVLILEGLPEDLIPGAAKAIAYRVGKCPVDRLRRKHIARVLELSPPRLHNEILDLFNQGRKDWTVAIGEGLRRVRPKQPWRPTSHQAMRLNIKAAKLKEKHDKLIVEARQWARKGEKRRDFETHFNLYRKDRTSLPGIREEIREIWEDIA